MHVPRDDTTWIQTFTGKRFWPLDPRPEEVNILDIAHALSLKCRFTGQCRCFYSVAQHSVHVAEVTGSLWGLLHDAGEAYLADVATPVKKHLPDFHTLEANIMRAVCDRFGLPLIEPPEVKHADRVLLATERRDLMPSPPRPWLLAENVAPLEKVIRPWAPIVAELAFLSAFERLSK